MKPEKMNKKKYKNFRMQYIFHYVCEGKPEYTFGLPVPDLKKESIFKLLKFVETVISVKGGLKDFGTHMTVGVKLINVKSTRTYGAYVKISPEIFEHHVEKKALATDAIQWLKFVQKTLEKDLYKFKLTDGVFPKPIKTI